MHRLPRQRRSDALPVPLQLDSLDVWSRDEVVRVDFKRVWVRFQASQMVLNGVRHWRALRCLAKL